MALKYLEIIQRKKAHCPSKNILNIIIHYEKTMQQKWIECVMWQNSVKISVCIYFKLQTSLKVQQMPLRNLKGMKNHY